MKMLFLSLIVFATLLGGESDFFLPSEHELRLKLDRLFADPSVLDNQESLDAAGFKTLYARSSGMRVLKHKKLSGYLIKTFLKDENKKNLDSIGWMVQRCLGAENVRNLIKEENLKYFTVPDKWIYFLPGSERAVLVVTNMRLVSREKSKRAWKTKITPEHVQELYSILIHGFASCYLVHNIPFTKEGTFSCIDTAYPKRVHHLYHVRSYLSEEIRDIWDSLVGE